MHALCILHAGNSEEQLTHIIHVAVTFLEVTSWKLVLHLKLYNVDLAAYCIDYEIISRLYYYCWFVSYVDTHFG